MRRFIRRGLKLFVPAVVFLSLVPVGRADAAIGPCGYAWVQTINVTLVTYCTPAQCAGIAVPPVNVGVGTISAEEFVCVRI